MKRINALLVIAVLLFSAAGCSRGGGGSSTPRLRFGVKQLLFNWSAVEGTDHYRILVDPDGPDGVSGFSVVPNAELISSTSTSHAVDVAVHLTDWFAAQYKVEACDDLEIACKNISNVALTPADAVAATGYFKASNAEFMNFFGRSVALSSDGNTLAVGAPGEGSAATGIDGDQNQDANTAGDAGAVYVFSRDTAGSWSQQAYVKASNTGIGDQFGYAVALSGDGNTLAVGAYLEASSATGIDGDQADNTAGGAGAVYVFTRGTRTTWSQQAYVKASNTDADDQFGWSVALSGDGNTLAVGADHEASSATGVNNGNDANNSAFYAGAAYVFSRGTGTTWSQQAYVKAFNTGTYDMFGHSVALSSDGATLAVGAYGEEANAGAVYVFSRNTGTTWSQQAYVKASNTGIGDKFGWSVALSSDGNTLAVGAKSEASIATGVNGGPTAEADNSAVDAGAAYVFSRGTGTTWSQQAYVKASNTDVNHAYGNDQFGWSVALSGDGNTLAVGAYYEDSTATGINGNQAANTAVRAGAVYVFTRPVGSWLQQAYVKASNTDLGDQFGSAVALSVDGTTLAVGADGEASGATGVGGNQKDNRWPSAGAVYLY